MNTQKIPSKAFIKRLADFWDSHDLSDFEDQLEEVTEPLFERRTEAILVPFDPKEVQAVKRIAKSQGVADAALIRGWVVERLQLAG